MKAGDDKALATLFTLFYAALYHYGMKMFNISDLVKDSIHDVFLRIWERRQTLGEVQNPKAYLIASLRRKLLQNKSIYITGEIDEYKTNNIVQPFSFDSAEFIEMAEVSQQLRAELSFALNNLPEKQRKVVYLRFYCDLKYREIAEVMEVKEQTVKNLMFRTMQALSDKMDPQLWESIDYVDPY